MAPIRGIPFGTRRTGTTTSTGQRTTNSSGTTVQPGSAAGSALGSGASILGLLYGMGQFGGGGGQQQNSNFFNPSPNVGTGNNSFLFNNPFGRP